MTTTPTGRPLYDRHHVPVQGLRHDILRRAAEAAAAAPSVHNTQPWALVLRDGWLEIWEDASRQLAVLDPRKRQLTVSCGCALFNARVAIEGSGHVAIVERFPDPARPHLLARLTCGEALDATEIGQLAAMIAERRTNRRRFLDHDVPGNVVYRLAAAALHEGGFLLPVRRPDQADLVARLCRDASRLEQVDPSYLSELRQWTTDDPRRPDGVQLAEVPLYAEDTVVDDELPLRQFDLDGLGWLPESSGSGADQCLLVIGSMTDDAAGWLRAGESLERVWLELTAESFSATPLTQLIEVHRTYDALRSQLRLEAFPALVLRVGRAARAQASLRRPIADVLTDTEV